MLKNKAFDFLLKEADLYEDIIKNKKEDNKNLDNQTFVIAKDLLDEPDLYEDVCNK